MIATYRLPAYIAPKIEEKLLQYDLREELIDFFFDIYNFFQEIRYLAIFIIPFDFKSIFLSNPKLKILISKLENTTQCNVIFGKIDSPLNCTINLISIFPDFETAIYSKKAIISSFYNKRYPFLIDIQDYKVVKNTCNNCDGNHHLCQKDQLIPVGAVPDLNSLGFIQEILCKSISQLHIKMNDINEKDFKLIAFIVGLLNHIDEKYLQLINTFKIHEDIFKDIKSCPGNDYVNIAFSMFRAVAFPKLSSKVRHKFSIDFHQNNPFKINGYELYRLDVMPPNKSGMSSSGLERLLLAIKNGQKHFICYTSNHDFVKSTIIKRTLP